MANVSVVGLGYVGLPTAAMLARAGHVVFGFDASERVRESLRNGCHHVVEADVRALVLGALATANLKVVDRPAPADVHIVCVPTPATHEGRADLRYVQAATDAVVALMRPTDLYILESTVPPGTVDRVVMPILERHGLAPAAVDVAHCPERVLPGDIVNELVRNPRLIGGNTARAAARARDLYRSFVTGSIEISDCKTAELVKVVENTYRDVNIALANELAILAEAVGVDVWEVIRLANKHPRVNVLLPGPGVGGHCIPIDSQFLAGSNPFQTELTQAARRINGRMPVYVANRIENFVQPPGKIAVLGATYKADVDDTRNSPVETLVTVLLERGFDVSVFDPLAQSFAFPLERSLQSTLKGASMIVLAVGHRAFAEIDPVAARAAIGDPAGDVEHRPVLVDTRRFFDIATWTAAGFFVYSLGLADRSVQAPGRPDRAHLSTIR